MLIGDNPVQRIHKNPNFELEYDDLADTGQNPGKVKPGPDVISIINNFIRPFNLAKAPLLRLGLVKLSEEKYTLMYDMHHIINDDVSSFIFINEFIYLYEGMKLPPLNIQYKDFALWQNDLIQSGKSKEQGDYWLSAFSGEIPPQVQPQK